MRGTGRMGGERVTVKNLQIVKVDAEQNLIYVRGAVPGPESGFLTIRRAKRG
jgi:large subunit ribosomal protein L3